MEKAGGRPLDEARPWLLRQSRCEYAPYGFGFDKETVMAVGRFYLEKPGSWNHLGPGFHVLGREEFIRGHADEGTVGLDRIEDLFNSAAPASYIIAVHFVADVKV